MVEGARLESRGGGSLGRGEPCRDPRHQVRDETSGSELWHVSFRGERTRRSTGIAVGEAGERCVI